MAYDLKETMEIVGLGLAEIIREVCEKLADEKHFTPVQIAEIAFFLGETGMAYDGIEDHLPKFLKWYAARSKDSVTDYWDAVLRNEVMD